jgi:transposase InsO family protein
MNYRGLTCQYRFKVTTDSNHSYPIAKSRAVHDEPLRNRKQMRQAIFEDIEVDYNLTRLHSALGYLSPTQFEQLNVA